jgi:hypothetical protein
VTRRAANLSSRLAALAFAQLLIAACGGSSGGSSDASSDGRSARNSARNADIFVRDDFSDPASGWSRENNDAVMLDYADGGYRILMKTPGPRDARLSFGSTDEPPAVEAVSVEADATQRAGPYSSGQKDEFEFHGVVCWGADAQSDDLRFGYKFVLTPERHYGILRDDQSADGLVVLAEGDLDSAGYGTTNRIRGECTLRGGGSTLLVLYVDGKKIAQARDSDGPERFAAIGLTVETSEVGTDIHFDNLLARNPLARPPSRSEPFPANQTSSAPFSDTNSARSRSKLCKKEGIRYLGTTPQRGDVCFTVNQDHTRLLEVGFTFVPANRCPAMATGTVYTEGEAGPTVTRHQVRSSGFTGSIEGAEASGILQDWDICRERTFAWRAHRVPSVRVGAEAR